MPISTGYQPQFALGALYQGINAANQQEGDELELVKQFLANQREQQMQPIDVEQANQNLFANMYKTDPRYQEGMTQTIEGQGMSNLAAGQTARGLQPFKQTAGQAELENQAAKESLFGKMFKGVDTQYDRSKPESDRLSAAQVTADLADTLSEIDPKFIQQKKLLDMKGEDALALAEARQAIRLKEAEAKRSDPKYKEQLALAFKIVADPGATPQQKYEAEMFIHLDQQSRLASNPSAYTPKMDLPAMTKGKVVNQPAPVQQSTRPQPPTGQQTSQQPSLPQGWTIK